MNNLPHGLGDSPSRSLAARGQASPVDVESCGDLMGLTIVNVPGVCPVYYRLTRQSHGACMIRTLPLYCSPCKLSLVPRACILPVLSAWER